MIILDKQQANLLRSFLVGHSKEIENSEHTNAMLEILSILTGKSRPDEGMVCGVLLQNIDLLTCLSCGAKLVDVEEGEVTLRKDDFMGEFCVDPGESNYPHEPDVPAAAYFVCVECSRFSSLL